ncbi:EAL domain-containing protein [Calothrix sp. FACHB-1219]|uniref:EAL domain-containing protein n=1 Tax=unclassified Calothrix TaxID=2619626 RepID=UPI0016825ABC|nr:MULTISPECIES: EAL domain-containing protein [unclassified Calothrix]MBD2206294.1 EAL domain-containing protein [Calothrix sp. FACHB-168]MBD2221076.1 EAL domain-containing protein [Calothrix sp. FACHB-1219]
MGDLNASFDIVDNQTNNITTEPELEDIPDHHSQNINLGTIKPSGDLYHLQPPISQLRNFLEPYESLIKNLIQQFTNLVKERLAVDYQTINNYILNIIRQTSEADLAFILGSDRADNLYIKSHSNLGQDIDQKFYFNTLNTHILPTVSQVAIFNPAYHGIYRLHEDTNGERKAFVFIPLKDLPQAEVIVVCGIPQDSYLLGDIYGRILSSFYQAAQKFSHNPALVEAVILDDLKQDFGFIAAHLYERRFQLFCDRLQKMIVYFEPVLHLDPDELFISSWEALARDPDTLTAPVDLFQAAEMWGTRFIVELDQYFLRTATSSYQEARKQSKQNRSKDIVPLSVNVYPESLIRTAYFETVRQVLQEKTITSRNLILEISEKTELPQFNEGVQLKSPLTFFKKKLLEYVSQLQIRFAIDDFGVGYASVARLAGLNPSHVKIDRNILYHQPSDIIIRFVHELVSANNLNPSNVIVEGVDETTPMSLYHLHKIGVKYIQGHIVAKPSPDIYRLSKEKYHDLRRLILDKPH